MVKIPRLFNKEGEVNPECQWVIDGEGWATVKFDGTPIMIDEDQKWWERRTLRKKQKDAPPFDWIPCCERPRQGDWPGWMPMAGGKAQTPSHTPGTYEFIGPSVRGNAELQAAHRLVLHGSVRLPDCPRTREQLIVYLEDKDIEGVVFYHPDGRMAKVRKETDLGMPRRKGTRKKHEEMKRYL